MSEKPEKDEVTIVCHPSMREFIQGMVDFLTMNSSDLEVEVLPSPLVPTGKLYLFRHPKFEIDVYGLNKPGLLEPYSRETRLLDTWLKRRQPWPPPAGNIKNINPV